MAAEDCHLLVDPSCPAVCHPDSLFSPPSSLRFLGTCLRLQLYLIANSFSLLPYKTASNQSLSVFPGPPSKGRTIPQTTQEEGARPLDLPLVGLPLQGHTGNNPGLGQPWNLLGNSLHGPPPQPIALGGGVVLILALPHPAHHASVGWI